MSVTSLFQNKFVSIKKWHAHEHQTQKALRKGGAKSKLGATNHHNDPRKTLEQHQLNYLAVHLTWSKYVVHIFTL